MQESNSFKNAELLEHLISSGKPTLRPTVSQARSDAAPKIAEPESNLAADVVLDDVISEITQQFRLREILEEACVVTGATGAAIALARGEVLVCRATAGGDAPDLGVCLNPNSGLSGSCIQTRQLQRCDDTETDPRVDSEACRQLGVRSIAVLPLVRGNELLGVFEILSSRPNAFGQEELDSMQALSTRILQRKRQEAESTTKVPTRSSAPPSRPEKVSVRNKASTRVSDPGNPRRNQASRSRDLRTPILGMLVIIAALLLGVLVGLRIGWERAILQNRNRELPQGARAPATSVRPDEMLPPNVPVHPTSAPVARPNPVTTLPTQRVSAASKRPADPGDELKIHQDGKVIFVAPPSTSQVSQTRNPHSLPKTRKKIRPTESAGHDQKYALNQPIKLLFALGVVPPGYALLERVGRKTGEPAHVLRDDNPRTRQRCPSD